MRLADKSLNAGCRLFHRAQFTAALLFVPFLFLVLGATAAFGQFTTARLSGTIQDNSGAAVPGASVTVEQVGTGYKQQVKSGEAGEYLFPSLPVGEYQLTVEMTGFNTYLQKGIALQVGQATTQQIKLVVGTVTQQVTVEGNTNQVTTDDAAITQVIDQKSMESMPLNGREAQQLVFLVPGAVDVSGQNCGANCEGGVLPDREAGGQHRSAVHSVRPDVWFQCASVRHGSHTDRAVIRRRPVEGAVASDRGAAEGSGADLSVDRVAGTARSR